jgi:hypothetical protein
MMCVPLLAPGQPAESEAEVHCGADYLAMCAAFLESSKAPFVQDEQLASLLAAIRERPRNDELRIRAIDTARRFASPADLAARPGALAARDYGYDRMRVEMAWKILQATETLRKGMTLEDAVALLGRPTKEFKDGNSGGTTHEWYYSSPMHINPCLRLTFVDDKVTEIATATY